MKKLIAVLSAVAILVCGFPLGVFALTDPEKYGFGQQGDIVLHTEGGNVDYDPTWESTYPYGTFAFGDFEMNVAEDPTDGGNRLTVPVYRLGGTAGKATVFVEYTPAAAEMEDGSVSYAYAASAKTDLKISVEDPQPIAQYQKLGQDPLLPAPKGVALTAALNEAGDKYDVKLTDGDTPVEAEGYRWQSYNFELGRWTYVTGAADAVLSVDTAVLDDPDGYENDFRCVYTIGGQTYCTPTLIFGLPYDPAEDGAKEIPAGVGYTDEPTYTALTLENEYDACGFDLVFAEDEWVKTIVVEAIDDSETELDEIGLFTITGCMGGTDTTVCNTLALGVIDNESPLPSSIGFTVTSVTADQDDGCAKVTVERTGCLGYVTTVKYATENGTALSGHQYTASSGEITFGGDVCRATVSIPLLAEDKRTEEKTFTLRLSDVRGGGTEGLCTLTDNAAVTVHLTSGGKAKAEGKLNLSSVVTTADADRSSALTVEETPLLEEKEPTAAEPVEESDEKLTGNIVPRNTYDYSEGIRFSRKAVTNYDSLRYWQDNEYVLGASFKDKVGYSSLFQKPTFETNSRNPDGIYPKAMFNVSSDELEMAHNDSTITPGSLTISDAGRLFSEAYWVVGLDKYGIARWDGDKKLSEKNYRYVMPYLTASCGDNEWTGNFGFKYFTNDSSAIGRNPERGSFTLDFAPSEFNFTLAMVLHQNGQNGPTPTAAAKKYANGCTHIRVDDLNFTRRIFAKSNDIGLRIYTANDKDTHGEYAQLDADSEVYQFLRPDVSIVEGAGGVDDRGRLYVGSQLYVQLNSSASYTPYNGTAADKTVYLTNDKGEKIPAKVEKDGQKDAYYITLLWDGMTIDDLTNRSYQLNIIVTRKQKLTVDMTPSLLRDGNGKTRTDSESYNATWEKLVYGADGKPRTVTAVSSAVTDTAPYYAVKTHTFAADKLFPNGCCASVTVTPESDPRLENIQSVNFGLDPEDIVMFGGLTYAGDETIPLSLADLASGNLTFRFYDAAYLAAESETAATISHTELFYDTDGNGRIDGYYDEKIGYFIPDTASGDISLGMVEGSIPETDLLPAVDMDGTVHQYFLKVYYSVTPRSLQKKSEDKLQILPAFITAQTDKEALSLLTEEEKSYRVITAGSTDILPFDARTGQYGTKTHIGDTSADHAMYGAEASRMSTLDIPLGGDTRYYNGMEITKDGKTAKLPCTDFCGNLRVPFENPSEITLSESGSTTYPVQDVNGYLGAFVDISTFLLCVQTQRPIATLDDIVPETITMGTVETRRKAPDMSDMAEEPNVTAKFDTNADGGSPMPAGDLAANMNLPAFTGSVTSFLNVTTLNGNQVLFSFGIPVGQFAYSASSKNTKGANGESINEKYTVDDNGNRVTTKTTVKEVRDENGNPKTVTTVEQKVEDTPTRVTNKDGSETVTYTTHTKTVTDGGKPVYVNREVECREWVDEKGVVHSDELSIGVTHSEYDISGHALKGSVPAKRDAKNLGADLSKLFSGNVLKQSDNYQKVKGNNENHFRTFAINFTIKLAALMQYDNLKGDWNIVRAVFSATAAVSFRYEFRFCPIVYFYVKVSLSVTFSANANFPFVKKAGDPLKPVAVSALGCGETKPGATLRKGTWAVFSLNTAERKQNGTWLNGFRMRFKGKVNMYVAEDTAYFSDTEKNSGKFITKGTLSSNGLTDTDVRMDEHTGKNLYVALFAREDTVLENCRELFVTGRKMDYEYTGINIDVTAETGLGLEFFIGEVEVYFRFNVNIIIQLGGTNLETGKRDSDMTWFRLSASAGINVRVLFFRWSMDFIGFYLTCQKAYPHAPAKWTREVKALGRAVPVSGMLRSDDGLIRIKADGPANTARAQQLYGVIPSNAYDPEDATVPFQFSGYGTTGTGFKLVDDLTDGYNYRAFTVGGDSYILYPISVSGVANNVDATQLVMSRVVATGEETGLANPLNPDRPVPYIVVDDHATAAANTGDLDFDVAVDGRKVTVTWTGYAAPAAAGDITLTEASKNTVVKRASIDLGDESATGFAGHTVLTDGVGQYRQMAKAAGDAVFYAETNGYTTVEQTINDYATYLQKTKGLTAQEIASGATTPEKATDLFRYQNGRSLAELGGDGSSLIAVTADGKTVKTDISGGRNECIADLAVTENGTGFIAAYTTQSVAYFDKSGITVSAAGFDKDTARATVKRMYLRAFDGNAWGEPVLLRTLVDFDDCYENNMSASPDFIDGVYADGRCTEQTADPHIGELRFLPVDLDGTGTQTVLTFLMNGNTYLMEEDGISGILTGGSASMRVIFDEDAGQNATLGSDGNGKLVILYTKTVENTPNTALYTAWWDNAAGTWGEGNILAMNHLQVYEDRVKYGLSPEELEKAFLGEVTGNEEYDAYIAALDEKAGKDGRNTAKGGMDLVTFSDLQTLAVTVTSEDGTEERQELLAFAEAAKSGLKHVQTETEDGTVDQVVSDGEDARIGFYAITFGAGEQQVADESLRLEVENFAAGTRLKGTVGFDNLGTAALRGSEANPITVELKAVTDQSTYVQTLAKWNVTSSIPSGGHTELELCTEPLAADLPDGTHFVLTVSEDKAYIEEMGGVAYGSVSDALYTVGGAPELAIEQSKLTFSRVVGDKVYYDVDMTVTNRGSEAADGLTMQFTVADGAGDLTPLDITGSTLTVEREMPLRLNAAATTDHSIGLVALADEDGKRNLSPGYSRRINGTLCIPKSAFSADGLTVRAELFCNGDDTTVKGGLYTVTHNETYAENNTAEIRLEHNTVFAQPLQINMTVGATLSMSCLYTSTTDANDIVVREISNGDETWKPILHILEYRQQHITAVPSEAGSTVIQVEDRATNSFVEVAVIVAEQEDAINISPENADLTFVKAAGSVKADSWVMEYGVSSWSGDTRRAPMKNDICVSTEKGSVITLGTTASSMVLYYSGDLRVDSDLFGDVLTRDVNPGWMLVDFHNKNELYHTVTVTANTAGVQVDRYLLNFGQAAEERILADTQPPAIIIANSYPLAEFLADRTAVRIGAYITDNTRVASAVWYGALPEEPQKLGQNLWYLEATVSGNGVFTIEATDANGNMQVYSYDVNWYTATGGEREAPVYPKPGAEVTFVDHNDNKVERLVREAYFVSGAANEEKYPSAQFSPDGDFENNSESLTKQKDDYRGAYYPANRNGFYQLYVWNGGHWTKKIVYFDKIGVTPAKIDVTQEGSTLQISVDSQTDIVRVRLNDETVATTPGTTYRARIPVAYGGNYTVSVDNGVYVSAKDFNITLPIVYDWAKLTVKTRETDGENAVLFGEPESITGGDYAEKEYNYATDKTAYRVNYTYGVAPVIDGTVRVDLAQWADVPEVRGFENERYVALIRSSERSVITSPMFQFGKDLDGMITLEGDPYIGQTLTAKVENANNTAPLRYTWYRVNSRTDKATAISGATGDTYTMTKADGTYYIRCDVTTENEVGALRATTARICRPKVEDTVVIYDGKPHTVGGTYTYEATGFMVRFGDRFMTGATKPPTFTEVGEYTVRYGYSTSAIVGSVATYDTAKVTILPKPIDDPTLGLAVTFDKPSQLYTGTPLTANVVSATVDGLPMTFEAFGRSATEVGKHTVVLTGTGNFTGSVTAEWEIVEFAGKTAVTGDLRVGETLTAKVDANVTDGIRYQWVRYSIDNPYAPILIDGATGPTYTLTPDDVLCTLECVASHETLYGTIPSGQTGTVMLNATGFDGVYDGKPHTVTFDHPEVCTIVFDKYDLSKTTPPVYTDVCDRTVTYYLVSPGGILVEGKVPMHIRAKELRDGDGFEVVIKEGKRTFAYTGDMMKPTVQSVTLDGLPVTYHVSGDEQKKPGTYTLYITGNGNYTGKVAVEWSIVGDPLEGKVTVDGVLQYGKTLMVTVEDANSTDLRYQWCRYTGTSPKYREVIPGATEKTYVLNAGDIACNIVCYVTAGDKDGYIQSERTDWIHPEIRNWTGLYDGKPHTVVIGETAGFTVEFPEGRGSTPPSFTEVGVYTVKYTMSFKWGNSLSGTARVTIGEPTGAKRPQKPTKEDDKPDEPHSPLTGEPFPVIPAALLVAALTALLTLRRKRRA